ncbi:hypothetical protein L1887_08321 [Cichorium endivia]|nr:hypothetical protein L1887_08321 [Cichorium endivia]
MNATKHEALWLLGSAYIDMASLIPDPDEAKVDFDKEYFQKTVELCPGNERYLKSLRLNEHDRKWHATAAYSNAKGDAKKKKSDLKYDIFGWFTLAVGLVVCIRKFR